MEGNQKKMREALVDMYNMLEKLQLYTPHINDVSLMRAFRGRIRRAKKIVDVALSAPQRQCDVGTASEQSLRFNAFCMEHHFDSDIARCKCKFEAGRARCELAWAQTPYAEEK